MVVLKREDRKKLHYCKIKKVEKQLTRERNKWNHICVDKRAKGDCSVNKRTYKKIKQIKHVSIVPCAQVVFHYNTDDLTVQRIPLWDH